MTGLLIKELIARGDLQRCLIVCPGNLVEQWQDELFRRFHLPFEIMTNDKFEAARTGNWFTENPLSICRQVTEYVREEFNRAEQLKQQELAGKANAKINSGKARQRADELTMRLQPSVVMISSRGILVVLRDFASLR